MNIVKSLLFADLVPLYSSRSCGVLFVLPSSRMVSFTPKITTHKLFLFKHCLPRPLVSSSYCLILTSCLTISNNLHSTMKWWLTGKDSAYLTWWLAPWHLSNYAFFLPAFCSVYSTYLNPALSKTQGSFFINQ